MTFDSHPRLPESWILERDGAYCGGSRRKRVGMTRQQLEHIIRAAATIADDDEIIVVGSQSILGQFPDAPEELCRSMEADVWPRNHPDRWELVDGSIGELSPFHETFGYYAQGVGEETAVLPEGWQERLVKVDSPMTRGAVGLCLEIHDLVISKYVAEREKDMEFIRITIDHRMIQRPVLLHRLERTSISSSRRHRISGFITRDFGTGS